MTDTQAATFGATSTTDEVLEGIDLTGKTAVITGASGGLGTEIARSLASKGATVVLAVRDPAKLDAAVTKIKTLTGSDNADGVQLDLSDLDDVRSAMGEVLDKHPRIHMLINNAGVMACPFSRTKQGFELQFGINHVGHFLFTVLLVPALKAAAPARIVNVSSDGHKYACVDLGDPNWDGREYDKWQAYGAAKSCNALFAVALNNRLSPQGITANAVHPGAIRTNLGRYLTEQDIEFLTGQPKTDSATGANKPERVGAGDQMGKLVFKSVEAGAATTVWAATSPDLEGKGGLYLEDCQIGVEVEPPEESHGYYAYALDADLAERLWARTEGLIGESFDLYLT